MSSAYDVLTEAHSSLERAAVRYALEYGDGGAMPIAATVSLAISAKRIADSLSHVNDELYPALRDLIEGVELRYGLVEAETGWDHDPGLMRRARAAIARGKRP